MFRPIDEVTSMTMNNIERICDNIDLAARQLGDFYDNVKRCERYLNHCWCAKIKETYDSFQLSKQQLMTNFQRHVKTVRFGRGVQNDIDFNSFYSEHPCSTKTIDHFLSQQVKVQRKLAVFKRFSSEKYFRRNVIDYKNLLNEFKLENVYILHLYDDWLKDDKNRFHGNLQFFEYMKNDLLEYRIKDREAHFIIIDYDLNRHLLMNSNTLHQCCIHHVRSNVVASTDVYSDFISK